MSLNMHTDIELTPTTAKGAGAFVVIFDPGVQHLNL